jgi:ferredoxin
MSGSSAREAALAAAAEVRLEPTSLVSYRSNGRLLVVGDDSALARCEQLPDGVEHQQVTSTDRQLSVGGFLGAFTVRATGAQDGEVATYSADAVLDLHATPLLGAEMLPPGYFHCTDTELPADLLEDLANLTGEFQKPRYFDYDPSICAHGVNGKVVCSKCIDACPAEAITSLGERIEVNPNLCQGGGTCATVCPSGAIRYLYPNLRDQGKRMRTMIHAYRETAGEAPGVVFHTEGHALPEAVQQDQSWLPLAVEELGSVGMELCLSALAQGARQVVLLVGDDVPGRSRHGLESQLGWMHRLLEGLGLDPDRIALRQADASIDRIEAAPAIEPAQSDVPDGKRNAMFVALDHLAAQLKPAVSEVSLPAPAPFGEALIDADKCTLCMACVGACPGRALQDGSNREVPEVFFIEANCLQCGACVQTCPEDAIELTPRLLLDREKRIAARSLNQDRPFACISCGKPFAPTSVINKMLDKLKNHHMFGTDRALDRLKMCEDCRVVDIVQDPEAMGGQFDPLKNFRQ